jgi:hypothetical protein
MRTTLILTTLLALYAYSAATAKSPDLQRQDVLCKTSDGSVVITANRVLLRDYSFPFDRMAGDHVVVLRDNRSHAVLELDARGEQGIYLAVTEGGVTMQVVAPRSAMSFENEQDVRNDAAEPGAPGVDFRIIATSPAPIAAR